MKGTACLVSLLLLTLTIAACGGESESGPVNVTTSVGPGIDIRGKITDLATPLAGVNRGALAIEGEEAPDTRYQRRAALWMAQAVVIQRKQGDSVVPASVDDLKVGIRVEIKFVGVVAELQTINATAGEITILD